MCNVCTYGSCYAVGVYGPWLCDLIMAPSLVYIVQAKNSTGCGMGILIIVALHKEAVYLVATTASIGDVVGAFEQEACRERGREGGREREVGRADVQQANTSALTFVDLTYLANSEKVIESPHPPTCYEYRY